MNKKYGDTFPKFHKGMLEIVDVPNFTNVYIHVGNYKKDTLACVLTGYSANYNKLVQFFNTVWDGVGSLGQSVKAYTDVYQKISAVLDAGNSVDIEIRNLENELTK